MRCLALCRLAAGKQRKGRKSIMDNKEWFKNAGFGMMVHFGLYSVLGGEWKGQRMRYIGEWVQSKFRIPNAEYGQLTRAFNPIYFNAEEWVLTAKAAGMKYIVVTSKHHEGFALFDSEYDNYNAVKGTPFGRDIIAELAEACYKHGLKLGLYYSQDLDWHEENGGGYTCDHLNSDNMSWTNDWDYPDASKKDYSRCFETKIKTQMKEILTKYGDLLLVWCDTPRTISPAQSQELYDMIKHYQPDCLVNSRIGNGLGDYRSGHDNELTMNGETGLLCESPTTLNRTWGFKYYDDEWKSAERVKELRESLNANGVNYLVNVGPDWLGRLPAPAVDILKKVGQMD